MPELPEVEVVRRSLLPRVLNLRLGTVQVRQRRLRTRVDVRRLSRELPGRRVVDIRRRGKYLLLDLDSGWALLVHLGMTGRLSVVPSRRRKEVHDHVILSLAGGRQLRFNDARRFGLMELIPPGREPTHPRLQHLGLDPFDPAFDARWLRRAAHRRRRPVKSFLMDGTLITGIGNIYASESIHRAGVHPTRAAGSLSLPRCRRLTEAVRHILQEAIDEGGTTLRDFLDARGRIGEFRGRLLVYDREGEDCRRCGRAIRRIVQSGRSTFYCPCCQH